MIKRGRPRSFDRRTALQKAMELFWAQGFDSTSMADLINAMQINSPSIYATFGRKEALFQEAVALYIATEGERIWGTVATEPSARTAIETILLRSAEEFTRPNKPRGCLIILGALHTEGGNQTVRKELQKHRTECITKIHLRLKQDVSQGELPNGPDWRAIATFYVSVQQGMSIQARDGASQKTLLAVANLAITAFPSEAQTFTDREKLFCG